MSKKTTSNKTPPESLKSILQALENNPALAEHIHALINLSQNKVPNMIRADDVEAFIIQESRDLSKETFRSWASASCEAKAQKPEGTQIHKKKDSIGSPPAEKSTSKKPSSLTPKGKL